MGRLFVGIYALALFGTAAACGDVDANDSTVHLTEEQVGTRNTTGRESSNETENPATVLVQPRANAVVADCVNGGVELEYGVDEDQNGQLDPNEVDHTYFVCHGKNADASSSPLVQLSCNAGDTVVWSGSEWTCTRQPKDGIQGPDGQQGPNGPAGPAGARGAQGAVGPAGMAGSQGPVGPRGETGAAGAKGDRGDTGPQGPTGPRGEAGQKGDTGDVGPAIPWETAYTIDVDYMFFDDRSYVDDNMTIHAADDEGEGYSAWVRGPLEMIVGSPPTDIDPNKCDLRVLTEQGTLACSFAGSLPMCERTLIDVNDGFDGYHGGITMTALYGARFWVFSPTRKLSASEFKGKFYGIFKHDRKLHIQSRCIP